MATESQKLSALPQTNAASNLEVAIAAPTCTIAPAPASHPKSSTDDNTDDSANESQSDTPANACEFDPENGFSGEVNTNDKLPSERVLKKVEGMVVLDQNGKTIPFKDLYNGPDVPRRVMIIFIRHFFCGNCQEFIRTLTTSVSTQELLELSTPTFIAIVGCGDPSLIEMWLKETKCPFPVYSDPKMAIYKRLGMFKTLNLGTRPEYQRRSLPVLMGDATLQSIKQWKGGKALKGGTYKQVGGEFLFEPINLGTPITTPAPDDNDTGKQLGDAGPGENGDIGTGGYLEEKKVTWCHRMRTTRDHAEIPELREVLGLEGAGVAGKDAKRWSRALVERKGIGASLMSSSAGANSSASSSKAAILTPTATASAGHSTAGAGNPTAGAGHSTAGAGNPTASAGNANASASLDTINENK